MVGIARKVRKIRDIDSDVSSYFTDKCNLVENYFSGFVSVYAAIVYVID